MSKVNHEEFFYLGRETGHYWPLTSRQSKNCYFYPRFQRRKGLFMHLCYEKYIISLATNLQIFTISQI